MLTEMCFGGVVRGTLLGVGRGGYNVHNDAKVELNFIVNKFPSFNRALRLSVTDMKVILENKFKNYLLTIKSEILPLM